MTIARKKAVFLSVLLAVPSLAHAADESAFPVGTWGQTAKHCALFQEGAGADAIQITATERRYRESEGQLVKEPISITPQYNGRFRIVPTSPPDSSAWEDVWTTDGGQTMLARSAHEPSSIPVRKYVACTDKAAPAPGAFGKWKIDPNPDTPHATLDSGPEFPRIEVSCTAADALGYRFTMADGSFPKSINMPGAEEDINLAVGPSGFMPKNDASLFVREITDWINQAKSDGSTAPESAFVTQFGVNGKVPTVVPIGGLLAVREWLRPLCARAKIAPPTSETAGRWLFDLTPDTPHATLNVGAGVLKIDMFCTSKYTFNYRFVRENGVFPKSLTIPRKTGNFSLQFKEMGLLSAYNGDAFTSEIEFFFKKAITKDGIGSEDTFVVPIGIDGDSPIPVPVGNLEAVWAKLKPLCANAKTDLFPPRPQQATLTAPQLDGPLPASGQVTLSCDVTSRGSNAVGRILVSIDMKRGAYAIMNPASHAVSGVFGMISVDSSYRLQTASPMGRLLINRSTGELTNYNVSELMGADNRGFCTPAPSYVPFN